APTASVTARMGASRIKKIPRSSLVRAETEAAATVASSALGDSVGLRSVSGPAQRGAAACPAALRLRCPVPRLLFDFPRRGALAGFVEGLVTRNVPHGVPRSKLYWRKDKKTKRRTCGRAKIPG